MFRIGHQVLINGGLIPLSLITKHSTVNFIVAIPGTEVQSYSLEWKSAALSCSSRHNHNKMGRAAY